MNGPGFDPKTDRETDSDLRARFERLRAEERSAIPDFLPLRLERLRRAVPSGRWRLVGALAAGLLLALAGGLWHHRIAPLGAEPEPALADWRSPTDFLLETSNRDLFVGQPRLGALPSDLSIERSTAP